MRTFFRISSYTARVWSSLMRTSCNSCSARACSAFAVAVLLLHAGDLVSEDALSGREIGVERGDFLLDGLALRHDLGARLDLLAQRIPLREQLTDAADELVRLDEIIEHAPTWRRRCESSFMESPPQTRRPYFYRYTQCATGSNANRATVGNVARATLQSPLFPPTPGDTSRKTS